MLSSPSKSAHSPYIYWFVFFLVWLQFLLLLYWGTDLGICFIAGILFQSTMLVRFRGTKYELTTIGLIFLFSSLVLFLLPNIKSSLITWAIIYSVFFAWYYKASIIAEINEQILLIWNILYLYVYLKYGQGPDIVLYLVLGISLANLINNLVTAPPSLFFRVTFYVWFLIMIVNLALMQFNLGSLNLIDQTYSADKINYLAVFGTGMAFMYLAVHIYFLVIVLYPFPFFKGQTLGDRTYQWRKDIMLMANKFSVVQPAPITNIWILITLSGLLWLNHNYQFVSDWILIDYSIIASPLVMSLTNLKKKAVKSD
jgi:hypothetical protein